MAILVLVHGGQGSDHIGQSAEVSALGVEVGHASAKHHCAMVCLDQALLQVGQKSFWLFILGTREASG